MTAFFVAPAGLAPAVAWSIIAFAILSSTMAIAALLRWGTRLPQANLTDRSLHAAPVPRVGGVALWAGALPALLLQVALAPLVGGAFLLGWMLLTLVSLIDDMRGLNVGVRLGVQCLSAVLAASAMSIGTAFTPVVFCGIVVVMVWSANLYNFMDGSDGLAGLMALIGFAAFALAAPPVVALLCAAIAFAAIAPLWANWPPARLFLGDVGAVPLGFVAGAVGLGGVLAGHWAAWFPLLVFLPFIADASMTLLLRILRRERIWQAHRSHFYQRLHRAGAGHRGTLAVYGAWMAGTASTAVALWRWQPDYGSTALVAWSLVAAILFTGIDYHCRRMARLSQ